jgi:hypothetical protein
VDEYFTSSLLGKRVMKSSHPIVRETNQVTTVLTGNHLPLVRRNGLRCGRHGTL